jgi:hypothetical protein
MNRIRSKSIYRNELPLFAWAELQTKRIRRPIIVQRVAVRARISDLHAAAFCEANGIGPAGAR